MTLPRGLAAGVEFQGRYEIISELGIGSFGRVYKATQLSTGQFVAIKTLRTREEDTPADIELYRERLRREMRMCAAFSHPHIVRLIDFGDLEGGEGSLYAAFEYVPGETLRALLDRQGALAEWEAVRLMGQVLDALVCAHGQEIVHRDLKPENIMVSSTGLRRNAMVLDFGLGGFTEGPRARAQPRLTNSGEILGTPCYAAPEQLRGEPPSPLSDLYSWGLIFLECLTGHVALDGATANEVLAKQLGSDAIPIPEYLRQRRIGRLLSVVTAKDAAARRVSVAGILDTLAMLEREPARVSHDSTIVVDEAERRQLTVVSVHATVMRQDGNSAELEDFDRARTALQELGARISAETGGIVVRSAADRLTLAFGYPQALEHDARRAVDAAMRIVASDGPKDGTAWTLRAGIASGVVIVRDLGAVSGASRYDLVGIVPEVAASLERCAEPGTVFVDAETLPLVRESFTCDGAGETEIGGSARSMFRVVGLAARRPVPGSASLAETPLVGRDIECAQLTRLWQHALEGEPSVVLISGEPGIGKSRLIHELRRNVPTQRWLECRCAPETASSPLRPIIELLSTFGPMDQLLTRYRFDLPQTLPLFASLLSLSEASAPLRLSPDRARELTLTAIASLFLRMAKDNACVLAIEDVQWADPTTRELLAQLVNEMRAGQAEGDISLFLLCSARPEFSAVWVTEATVITPEKLGRGDIEKLVIALLPQHAKVDRELLMRIAERTDGIPLFVEELTHAIAAGDAPLPSKRRAEGGIPTTLRALLSARLDLLSESARETAQLAAALGRAFRYDVLEAATEKNPWVLQQDVEELLDARLLYRRRTAGDLVFKHALVRDTAYDSMVQSVRERSHSSVARALLGRLPDLVREQPEIVAQHLEQAGDLLDSAEYWYRAGDRAMRRGAYAEARQQLERGRGVLERCPVSDARRRAEMEMLTALGTVMFTTQGYAAPDVEQTFGRALSLCEGMEREASVKILSGIIGVYLTRGDAGATARLLPQFERMAERGDDKVAYVTGHTTLGIAKFWRGDHGAAEEHLRRACTGYRTPEFQQFASAYGYDGGLFCYGYRVWNLWVLGRPEHSERCYAEMEQIAEQSFDPYARSLALSFGMAAAYGRRDRELTAARSARLFELATEQRAYLLLAIAMCGRGGALTLGGAPEEGIAELEQGLSLVRMAGTGVLASFYATFLVEAQLAAGRTQEGLVTVEDTLAGAEGSLARFHVTELLRLRGELHEQARDFAAAAADYARGLELARDSGAAAYELRCAMGLARVARQVATAGDPSIALRAAYDRFTEGSVLPELRAAEELLARFEFHGQAGSSPGKTRGSRRNHHS